MSIRDLQTDQQPIEVQQLKARFDQIHAELIEVTPGLPTVLIEIHKMLMVHEELVHILDDDDIQAYHAAFEKYKHFALVAKEVKSSTSGRKKLKDSDLSNL